MFFFVVCNQVDRAVDVVAANTDEYARFPKIVCAIPGIITDYGTNDLNNMGAAMAPVDVIIAP